MLLVAIAVLYLVYYWSKIVTKSIKFSFLASLGLFISYLFYGLAGYIFPDMVIAGIIVATLIILTKSPYGIGWQAFLGLLLGFGGLVHFKMFVFAVMSVLVLAYRTWRHDHRLPYVAVVPVFVIGVIFLYYTHKWFGVWNPGAIDTDIGVSLRSSLVNNVSAILFDAARGVIPNSPIFLLLFLGLPMWFRKQREMLLMTVVCIVPSIALTVFFNGWGGGDAPVERYMMNFLPVLAPAIALAVQCLKVLWQRTLIVLLFIVTLLITLHCINIRRGGLVLFRRLTLPVLSNTPIAFDHLFPRFDLATNPIGHAWVKVAVDYLLVLCLVIYGWKMSGRSVPLSRTTSSAGR